ncbi:MAG: polysaccharide deacetylase family protein [Syntrophaceae bacterium]|nr:polysaccharide deacetylase family protein [Syntrophaceae bacterium]
MHLIKALSSYTRRQFRDTKWRAVILLYHRVTELSTDPQLLSVTRDNFARHLQVMKKHGKVVSLRRIADAIPSCSLPARSIAITFDDGYSDNLHNALPLLEQSHCPATFFISTGYVDRGREFWWDELDRVLLQPGLLPRTLDLKIDGSSYSWTLNDATYYNESDYQQNRLWNVLESDAPTSRQHIYRSICQLIQPLGDAERQGIINEFLKWAGAEPICRPTHGILSEKEIKRLSESRLAEIGSHTMSHPVLSKLNLDMQRVDIGENKAQLEKIIGRPVNSFSYPFGTETDYTDDTVSLVRQAGFQCACSNFPGVVSRDSDSFQLPRCLIRNWSDEEFEHRLEEFFNG